MDCNRRPKGDGNGILGRKRVIVASGIHREVTGRRMLCRDRHDFRSDCFWFGRTLSLSRPQEPKSASQNDACLLCPMAAKNRLQANPTRNHCRTPFGPTHALTTPCHMGTTYALALTRSKALNLASNLRRDIGFTWKDSSEETTSLSRVNPLTERRSSTNLSVRRTDPQSTA